MPAAVNVYNINDNDTTTRQGITTNFKSKNQQLPQSKYFLQTHFFTAPIFCYQANKSLELINRKVPVWRFEYKFRCLR